ncbi:MAG: hypothetical protein C4295_09325 [Candidatus Fervidibacterota bacterium]
MVRKLNAPSATLTSATWALGCHPFQSPSRSNRHSTNTFAGGSKEVRNSSRQLANANATPNNATLLRIPLTRFHQDKFGMSAQKCNVISTKWSPQ